MMPASLYTIFKNGSKTYFYSSLFFPKSVRDDVFRLYSFVRTVDNFVDAVPQQKKDFTDFVREYRRAVKGLPSKNVIIAEFISLQNQYRFPQDWVEAFIAAMAQDLSKSQYLTIAETETYMYGSAEVIGLMMAKILNLPVSSYPYARKLGRAMQFVNFIRDIQEDLTLKRTYLPLKELKTFGLRSLDVQEVVKNPQAYQRFIHKQLERYQTWQKEAEAGFQYIPKRYLIPIKTASQMYSWTARVIADQPLIVYQRKVKPSVVQIVTQVFLNLCRESLPLTATKPYSKVTRKAHHS